MLAAINDDFGGPDVTGMLASEDKHPRLGTAVPPNVIIFTLTSFLSGLTAIWSAQKTGLNQVPRHDPVCTQPHVALPSNTFANGSRKTSLGCGKEPSRMIGTAGGAMQVRFGARFWKPEGSEFQLLGVAWCLDDFNLAWLGSHNADVIAIEICGHGRVHIVGTVGEGTVVGVLDLPLSGWESWKWLLNFLEIRGLLYHYNIVRWLNGKTLSLGQADVKLGSNHGLDVSDDVGADTIRARVVSRRKLPGPKRITQEAFLLIYIKQR